MRNIIILYVSCLTVVCSLSETFYTIQEGDVITVHKSQGANIDDNWVAKAVYKNDINNTGFAYLEIETNSKADSIKQAINAGFLEGNLTADLIFSQWINTVDDFCKENGNEFCKGIVEFLAVNAKWVQEQVKTHRGDPYWDQVTLYYAQIDGMYLGLPKENSTNVLNFRNLTWFDVYWLNIYYDVMDLSEAIGGHQVVGSGSCSVLIKILPGFKDLYFGHNSWQKYQHMLKIQKKYTLRYTKTLTPGSGPIPGYEMAFTSYPGTICSQDDFYLISSGLAATETTNEIFNKTLWQFVTPNNTVFENVRSMVANRLATDGKSWNDIFKQFNSGTYNNQWMVLDYKKFKSGDKQLGKGLLWISEQIPSKIVAEDKTDVLLKNGYWSSYNIPYYKEIFEVSGYDKKLHDLGTWFSHNEAPRAQIFRRDHGKVVDMTSFFTLMRSNNFKNDEYARCNCTPPYSGCGAIAARDDLNLWNGTYQFEAQTRRPAGATDAKITNSQLFLKLQFMAVAGPTRGTGGKLPSFKWSSSNFTQTPRFSHPDIWEFKPVLHKWSLPLS